MTDIPNPRDGLTDDDIDRLTGDAPWNTWERVESRRAFCRSLLAADREARPAPASVEALIELARKVGRAAVTTVSPTERHIDFLDDGLLRFVSALAASTPPAEAQPVDTEVRCPQCWGSTVRGFQRGVKCLRCDGEGYITTPPASEARATGDAAKVATDAALDAVRDAMLEPSDGAAKRAFLAVELLGAMLAATGAAGEPQPLRWAMEYGAWEFPMGHPSRVTVVTLHDTESEAREAGMAAEFNFRVFPIYGPQAGEPQPRAGSKP